MELDELKQVWQRLESTLQKPNTAIEQQRVDRELGRVKGSLRPLYWGQVCQILFGILVISLAVCYWTQNLGVWYRVATGVVVHIYGVITIIMAGLTLARINRIEYSLPVMLIQQRLAELRAMFVLNGMLVGLPWWLLWIPSMAIIFGLLGVDLYLTAPAMVVCATLFGLGGLLATWLFHRWSHQPTRASLGQRLDDSAAGNSLGKARLILEEVRQFERE